ncbi:MAG: hypothetical protein LBG97_09925 [Coriobacteriales bacterium]|jgi:hypothetical protein|nr:hypothetical protein [Coriobacteriales bacterium]
MNSNSETTTQNVVCSSLQNTENLALREQRILDAVSLKEPDRVPILAPTTNAYPYFAANHSMAQVTYDIDLALNDIRAFLTEFQPDTGFGAGSCFEGYGPMLELADCKCYLWAGMPGNRIPEDSIQQFIEFPTLEDGEMQGLLSNRDWTMLTKILPRAYGVFSPFAKINTSGAYFPKLGYESIAFGFMQPEVQDAIEKLRQLGGMWGAYYGKTGAFANEIEQMGFPCMSGIPGMVPFDWYSNFLRGTMNASMDLFDMPELVQELLQIVIPIGVGNIKFREPKRNRFTYIFMHKGMDGFLSDEQYEHFYWCNFMPQVEAIIASGSIPYIFTEGPYNTRFKFLKQLPPGKCVVHFEDVDMALAKRELTGVACIAGNFRYQTLARGTKEQVVEEAKQLLDTCAPGGGYMFDLDGGMYGLPRENLEALYGYLKDAGKY